MVQAVDPDAAHRIVDGREDLHRHLARIFSDEVHVDFEDTAELALQVVRIDMREVEVDAVLAVDAQTHVHADLEDSARGDVTRHEVAVCRIHVLKEVPGLAVAIDPDASAFTAARLAHQTVLVGTRNRRRMNLDELGVADVCALLIDSGNSRAVADRRSRAATEHLAGAARREDNDVGGERLDLHRVHVLRDDAAADAVLVLDDADEFPELILLDAALDFPTANLLVERIEELLTRRRAGETGALVLLTAEVAKVEVAFRRAREGNAHAVEHLDELRRRLDHALDRDLVSEEVAAVDRIIEVLVNAVMLALRVHAGIDAALRTQRVGALHGAVGKQVDFAAELTDLDGRHETRETAAYNNDFFLFSHVGSLLIYTSQTIDQCMGTK